MSIIDLKILFEEFNSLYPDYGLSVLYDDKGLILKFSKDYNWMAHLVPYQTSTENYFEYIDLVKIVEEAEENALLNNSL